MEVFIVLGIIFTFIIVIAIAVTIDESRTNWKDYLEATRRNSKKCGKATFDDFVRYFDEYKLIHHRSNYYDNSFIDGSTNSQYHCNIIKFNNNGMLLSYSDYKKVKLFIKTIVKELNENGNGVKW